MGIVYSPILNEFDSSPKKNSIEYPTGAMDEAIKKFNERMKNSNGKLTLDGNGKIVDCKYSKQS